MLRTRLLNASMLNSSYLITSPPLLSTPSRSFCLRRLYLIGRST
ncbi:hypothetical protein L249_1946 [Ophiocordyceps polyrhachis-furcata BCC 54312]|uniref:Uncharacterized protein n=1 Tax=Ophiocordyceps polyrhachis-furcata BCC 54312 TaxID=1330021 RepID=A0A367LQU2_9HYPO|nr:hypothetical protein L249_1946 [Ophiocordyceps polyrhachis-furcata BCC 54312]